MTETKPQSSILNLQFLKLGGSLITEKDRAHTSRPQVLARLAGEIAAALGRAPDLRLVLGHGSGSFGHIPARRYGTRQGVRTQVEWQGFVEVWREAAELNRLVMDALTAAGLPAIVFPPSSGVSARDGQVAYWDLAPMRAALEARLLPVVYGDVVFDARRGGTILSTEDLFAHLALELRPVRISLAGLEPGVWADYPASTRLIEEIRPETLAAVAPGIAGSAATDVTGGMFSKVQQSLDLARQIPELQVLIFSGETPGAVERALGGESIGTLVRG